MNLNATFILLLGCLSIVATTACNGHGATGALARIAAGHYNGFYVTAADSFTAQTFVNGSLTIDKNAKAARAEFVDFNQKKLVFSGSAKNSNATQINLTFENGTTSPVSFELTWNAKHSCYEPAGSTPAGNDLCMSYNQEIVIDLAQYAGASLRLIVDFQAPGDAPTVVPPKAYSVEELVNLAKSRSFTSQLQLENVKASRDKVIAAYAGLLPSLNIGNVFKSIIVNSQFLLTSVGQLAPFLLPSNWINAKSSSIQLNMDKDSFLLMQADSANTTEGLAYSVLRDQRSLDVLAAYLPKLQDLAARLANGEVNGTEPAGSAAAIQTVISNIKKTQVALQTTRDSEKRALSQSIGILDPEAVSDVLPSPCISIETGELNLSPAAAPTGTPVATPPQCPSVQDLFQYDESSLESLVIERSIELQQMDSSIHLARNNQISAALSWLNPSVSIGLGFPATIDAAHYTIEQAEILRQQTQGNLLQSLATALSGIDESTKSYKLDSNALKVEQDRIIQIEYGMVLGHPASAESLESAYESAIQYETALINDEYLYYVSRAALYRVTYSGMYTDIRTRTTL